MATPKMISLFREQQDPPRRPMYFLASIFIHCGVISLLFFGIASIPQVDTQAVPARSMVRRINLKTPDAESQAEDKSAVDYPGARNTPVETTHAPRSALRLVSNSQTGRQTLIQPDVADPIKIQEQVPVPMVALWTPSKTPAREIVAPEQEQPAASNVTRSVERPNEETTLADVSLAPVSAEEPNIPLSASSTSPVEVNKPELPQQAPQTLTQADAQPVPAALLSLSDLEMKNGAITLPPVNESAQAKAPGELAPGKAQQTDADGGGTGSSRNGDRNSHASGAEQSARLGAQQSSTALALPRDGRFSAVIVGSSLADQFPEIASISTSRMAYVVYVHVGLARSWILQYSLTGDAEAAGGGVFHIDAPWPYNIIRPNLGGNAINSDALMIHGFVNASGRFEALRIVFPQTFSQAEFVLSALEQWQFRPAMQNGVAVSVEVLLIIPGDMN
jgi:hypothetical protein